MKNFFLPTQGQKKIKYGKLLKAFSNNNSGSSLISVIIAMGLILILVTVTLSTTSMNFYMKVNANESKKNFYDAEASLEEIRMGLAQVASNVFSEKYLDVMQNYNNYESDKKDEIFSSGYCVSVAKLIRSGADSTRWDRTKLEDMLRNTKAVYDSGVLTKGAKVTTPDGMNYLNITDEGVVLKNVRVKYVDENAYMTEIQTDILLPVPNVNFAAASTIPDLVNYTIVANESFSQDGILHVTGSAYLGKDKSKISGTMTFNTPQDIKDSGSASNVIFGNSSEFAKNSDVKFTDVNLYAGTLNVSGLNFTGINSEYTVSNDLNITGKNNSSTTVNLSGKYYGTGTGISASESSSIVVNKTKSSLDLSGLTSLIIGGVSYVNIKDSSDDKQDIMMGESISIKPDQRAYLVPANCVGAGYRMGGVNPMTSEQYEKLVLEMAGIPFNNVNYHDVYTETSLEIKNNAKSNNMVDYDEGLDFANNKSLKDLGVSGFREATLQTTRMKYLFMVFDSTDKAEAYFEKYYEKNANKTRLENNLNSYTNNKLKLPSITKSKADGETLDFFFSGSVVTTDKINEKNYINPGTLSPDDTELDAVNMLLNTKSNENRGLNVRLTKDYFSLSSEELAKDVYSNLVIDDMKMKKLFKDEGKYFVSETGECSYIKNGDVTSVKSVAAHSNVRNATDKNGSKHDDANLNVIIADGNVTLDCDFEGLILCSGKVIYNEGSTSHTSKANPTKVINALSAEDSDGLRGCDFLKNSDLYVVGGSSTTEEEQTDPFGIDKLVIYANWTKL